MISLPPSKAEQVASGELGPSWIGWFPLSVLPLIAIVCRISMNT